MPFKTLYMFFLPTAPANKPELYEVKEATISCYSFCKKRIFPFHAK